MFLAVAEDGPPLSADYFIGWTRGLRRAGAAVHIRIHPCVSLHRSDLATLEGIRAAHAQAGDVRCRGLWLKGGLVGSMDASEEQRAWEMPTLAGAMPCEVLLHEDPRDPAWSGDFSSHRSHPSDEGAHDVLAYLIAPHHRYRSRRAAANARQANAELAPSAIVGEWGAPIELSDEPPTAPMLAAAAPTPARRFAWWGLLAFVVAAVVTSALAWVPWLRGGLIWALEVSLLVILAALIGLGVGGRPTGALRRAQEWLTLSSAPNLLWTILLLSVQLIVLRHVAPPDAPGAGESSPGPAGESATEATAEESSSGPAGESAAEVSSTDSRRGPDGSASEGGSEGAGPAPVVPTGGETRAESDHSTSTVPVPARKFETCADLLTRRKKPPKKMFRSTSSLVAGIDVSVWQGAVPWSTLKEAGVEFAFIRASIGEGGHDERFSDNWQMTRLCGIPRGAYHVFYADEEVDPQVENFLRALGDDYGELPAVIDVESSRHSRAHPVDPAEAAQKILSWLAKVEARTGKRPMIYIQKWYWTYYFGRNEAFTDYPLWVGGTRMADKEWKWTFWQHGEPAEWDSGAGMVQWDRNLYRGTELARAVAAANRARQAK
jgi:lysozyme